MRYSLAASSPVSTITSVKSVTFSSRRLLSLKFSMPGQIFVPTASETYTRVRCTYTRRAEGSLSQTGEAIFFTTQLPSVWYCLNTRKSARNMPSLR